MKSRSTSEIEQRLPRLWPDKEIERLRIAYFSPLPPLRSGIADYSWDLLPHLAQHAEISLFAESSNNVAPVIRDLFPVRPIVDYPESRLSYDLALYHMGNSLHHRAIYQSALQYPGVVVLHDYSLHHFIAADTGSDAQYARYVRELAYDQGLTGVDRAWRIRYGQEPYPMFELPLNSRLIDRCLGVIVHSQLNQQKLQHNYPERPVDTLPQLMPIPKSRSRRSELHLPDNTLILATTGQITAERRMDLALEAFSKLLKSIPNAIYLIVGQVLDEAALSSTVRRFGLEDKVQILGYVPDLESFNDWTATADVIINLRYPTVGETSASALRAMAVGRPVIVFEHGTYAELPGDACCKIPPLNSEALLAEMTDLALNRERRERLGKQALLHVRRNHDPSEIANQTILLLHALLSRINKRYS